MKLDKWKLVDIETENDILCLYKEVTTSKTLPPKMALSFFIGPISKFGGAEAFRNWFIKVRVAAGDKGKGFLEVAEPELFLLFGRVCSLILLAPAFEQFFRFLFRMDINIGFRIGACDLRRTETTNAAAEKRRRPEVAECDETQSCSQHFPNLKAQLVLSKP